MRTHKREFLDQMERVVPWGELEALIAPYMPAPGPKGGRPPYSVSVLLRIHFVQPWFNLSDPTMEEALDDTPMFGGFAGLDIGQVALPDETTILRLRHLLERHDLVRKILDVVQALLQQLERIKASIRAKAEHPLHIVKNLLGYRKTHDRLPAKNTAQRMTLFALAHVWLARKRLLNMVPQG